MLRSILAFYSCPWFPTFRDRWRFASAGLKPWVPVAKPARRAHPLVTRRTKGGVAMRKTTFLKPQLDEGAPT
jgi:hypothetical protein